jgi:hypothetical protein
MERTIGIIGILITLFTAIAPIYVAYDIQSKQEELIPIRSISLKRNWTSDITQDFDSSSPVIDYELSYNGQPVKNLVTLTETLTNTGTDAILPSDFYSPIRVSVKDPWEILTIENKASKNRQSIEVNWRRTSPSSFEAEPFLFNPKDTLRATIYITTKSDDYRKFLDDDFPLKAEISDWSARIVKVEKIENDESSILYDYEKKGGNLNEWPRITIFLHGHGLLFFLIAAPTLIILFLYLLTKAKIVDIRLSKPFVISVVLVVLLSLATAEVVGYYVFPSALFDIMMSYKLSDHILNIFIIITFIFTLSYLLIKSKVLKKK